MVQHRRLCVQSRFLKALYQITAVCGRVIGSVSSHRTRGPVWVILGICKDTNKTT